MRTTIRAELAFGALLADGAAFALAVNAVGIGGESNPVATALFAAGGLNTVLLVKVAQALAAAGLTHRLRERRWSYAGAVAGIVGAVTALAALL